MQRSLVVSIHDVAPATRARVERIVTQLAQSGVVRCSLLVVPDYHHLGSSLGDERFTAWLRELEGKGHEIVIHGFYHQRSPRVGQSARQKLLTSVYTADEGEFFDLDYEEALRLLRKAQREFAARDFHPVGFIAPAWLLGAAARRAVVDAGFRYTTTLRAVSDLAAGAEFVSQSLVYSTRSKWRRVLSLGWNRTLFSCLTTNPLLRLGIHPPDIEHQAIWRQIRAVVDAALRDRRAATYRSWLAEHASTRHETSNIL